ncbi:MAG: hypothetical protein JNK82_27185 [Myxococcaceae bacterium]|nr:hypothetical protein [Myxococcaceae bacterium]
MSDRFSIAVGVTGLLVLLASACTKVPNVSACGPSTCSGCCATSGECITLERDEQCGVGGGSCIDCGALSSSCDVTAHTCRGPGDGGVSCNTSCFSGCCFNGSCLPYSGQSKSSCGTGAQACLACTTGNTCELGQCVPEVASITGSACMLDAECAGLDGGFTCRKQTSSGRFSYPQGYCTQTCGTSSPCAYDSVCVLADPHETTAYCMPRCTAPDTQSTCRDGYLCVSLLVGTGGVCWLNEPYYPDAGPPFDKVGAACTANATCDPAASGGAGKGLCIPEALTDGGASGFTGGYCTGSCLTDPRTCSTDGGAVCIGLSQSSAICQRTCARPWAGQGDCRQGYVCYGYRVLTSDGGSRPSSNGVCEPSCDVEGMFSSCGSGYYCDAGYCAQ